ncbi:hypothetical protein DBR42_18895 [Pelomonas sp. HMWF004]|nr:hypothetical protein DBR42_18895 [Pelomonas sp. HMWF004]
MLTHAEPINEIAEAPQVDAPAVEVAQPPVGLKGRTHAVLADAATHYKRSLRASPEAIEYLKGRGLTGEVAAYFGLGYARPTWRDLGDVIAAHDDEAVVSSGLLVLQDGDAEGSRFDRFRGRVMFPIRDRSGAVAGFGGRVLDDSDAPKYLNSPEGVTFRKRELLYGLYEAQEAIEAQGLAVVVEGYMDVVSLTQAGFGNAVAACGTACSSEQIAELLDLAPRLVFCFDGDAAGRRAAARALEAALPFATDENSIEFMFLPSQHDPDSLVRARGLAGFNVQLAQALPLAAFLIDHVSQGCKMEYAEGRARCAYVAGPLWLALPDGEAKQTLLNYCADLLNMQANEMRDFWLSAA